MGRRETTKTMTPNGYDVYCQNGRVTLEASYSDGRADHRTLASAKREARAYIYAYGHDGGRARSCREARALVGQLRVSDFSPERPRQSFDF